MRKYLSIIAIFLFMLGSFAQNRKTSQTDFFVSVAKGDDTNNGSSWRKPFQSIDKVLEVIGGNKGIGGEYNIYIAEGNYRLKSNNSNRIFKGNKKINFIGGFPTPSDDIDEDYVCTQIPAIYPVSFDYEGTDSMFRIQPSGDNDTDLHFEGINYHNTKYYGGIDDGTFLTMDGAHKSHVTMENMIISPYNAGQAGFIYIYNTVDSSFKVNKVFVSESKVTVEGGGFLKIYGGDLYTSNLNLKVEVTNSTFTNNTLAGTFGGSVIDAVGFNHGRNLTVKVTNSRFCNNTKNGGDRDGTALNLNQVAHVVIKNNRFENNKVTSGAVSLRNSKLDENISGNVWKGNVAKLSGGAIYSDGTPLTIDGDIFIDNTAPRSGGAVYAKGRDIIIENSIFCKNRTTGGGDGGGAVSIGGSSSFVSEGNYYNENFSESNGGAIRTQTSSTSRNDQFYNNISQSEGGAIYVHSTGNALEVINGQFFENSANGGVAGAIRTNSDLVTTNNIFKENSASNGNGGAIWAGRFYTSNNDKFLKNVSSKNGGAILFDDTLSILNLNGSVFKENDAKSSGGAVYSAGINSKVNANNTMFYKNTAGVDGGGLRLYGKSTFNNCDFLENSAGTNGGAIYSLNTWASDDGISFINSRAYGNSVNGDTGNPNKSDFHLEPMNYVKMVVTDGSKLQMPLDRYEKAGAGEGYRLDGSVTQSDHNTITPPESSMFTPNEPRKSCGPEENITTVCPTPAQTLDPEALITTDEGNLENPDVNSNYCWDERENATITMSSYTGKAPFTFEYRIVEINGETQQTVTGSKKTIDTNDSKEVTINIDGISTTQQVAFVTIKLLEPNNITKKGVTYRYEITKITDADGKSVDYTCTPPVSAKINIEPKPIVEADATNKDVFSGDTINLIGNFTKVETLTEDLKDKGKGGQWSDSTKVIKWNWQGPNNFTSDEQNPEIIYSTTANSGEYILTITDNNGCTAIDTVRVIVNEFICEITPNVEKSDIKSTKVGISTLNRNKEEWLNSNNTLGAYLVLESTKKGFVVPRFENESEIISNIGDSTSSDIEEGMIVWDKDANCLKLFFDKNNDGTMTWNCVSTNKCNNSKK